MAMTLGAGTIQQGDISGDVRDLQTILVGQGYNVGPIDGNFGPQTANAVRAFQSAHGLIPDGIVGPDTWGALHGQTPQPTFGPPAPVPARPAPVSLTARASMFSTIPPMAWYAVGGLAVLAMLTTGKGRRRRRR